MAIGVLIVTAIVLIKLKPAYQVSIDGEIIGYVNDKEKFEKFLDNELNDNEENNIAFADLKAMPVYQYKLIEKESTIEEEVVLTAIKENADITYFRYAITVNGKEKEYVNSKEEAEEIVSNIKEELNEQIGDIDISIARVYTKNIEVQGLVEMASVSDDLTTKVKEEIIEEEKRQKSTINGVYIAVVPVQGNITSRYGARESIRDHTHMGMDIAAKTGTPIKAAANGTVCYSGTMGGYGNLIMIDHGNGIKTYYGHCSKLYKKVGQKVSAGDLIAAVGNTGNSTGPHLHFEIRKNGVYVNPAPYLYN